VKPDWEYKRLGIRLYRGDCLDVLPELRLDRIRTIVTDPPYGETNLAYDAEPAIEWCDLLHGWQGTLASFASFKYALQLIPAMPLKFRYEMVWVKDKATRHLDANRRPLCNHELLLFFGAFRYRRTEFPRRYATTNLGRITKSVSRIGDHYHSNFLRTAYTYTDMECPKSAFSCPHEYGNSYGRRRPGHHPSQKPTAICKWLALTFTPRNGTILDPFMGSGTTGLACLETGRKFIGVELDKRYFAASVARIEGWLTANKKKVASG
jgi:site-specific DNA-methyltransferase (adenine-specific)